MPRLSIDPQAFIERVLQPSAAIFDDIRAARHAGHPQSAGIAQYLRYLSWHSLMWEKMALRGIVCGLAMLFSITQTA